MLSMSTSLIAVFTPILLMGGIVGKLFREFAVTLSVAIAVSMLVSLTTTPMLCARFLKSRDENRHGRIYRASESAFNWLHNEYARRIALGAAPPVAHSGCGGWHRCVERLPLHHRAQGLLSAAGHGAAGRTDDRCAGYCLRCDEGKQRQLAQMTIEDPAVQSVTAFVGGGARRRRQQHRRHVSCAEAAERSAGKGLSRPGGGAVAAQADQRSRRNTLSAGPAGHSGWRPRQLSTVPVHAFRRESE